MKGLNAMLLADFYKLAHRRQYPEGTEYVFSTWTPRSGKHLPNSEHAVCFGIQGFVKEFLIDFFNESFFSKDKQEIVKEYKRFVSATLLVKDPETDHIEDLHDLGYLPILVKSLEEGTRVPFRVPMMTIENTDPRFFWLTNYLETLASCNLWKPSTTATISLMYREILNKYAMETTGSMEGVEFQGHDFSMRGMSGMEDAARAGTGHLLSFVGTDTIPAIQYLEQYYNTDVTKELVGCSVPASEHSVMSSGSKEGEFETYRRLIEDVHPTGIVSLVSDTWNLWHVITDTLPKLKDKIMTRDGGPDSLDKVVIRPDCYDDQTKIMTERGWVFFDDLRPEDKVAQVLDDGSREYIKPTKVVKQRYEGPMVSFKDHFGKMDLIVTPNHRMIFNKKGTEFVQLAEDFTQGYHGKNIVRSSPTKDLNEFISPMDRLKIAFQADGSYQTGKTDRIRFSFSKERKIKRLSNILDQLNYEYKINNLGGGSVEFKVNTVVELSKDFNWVNTVNPCSNWCKQFINELSHWDATIRNEGRIKFDTTNENVIGVVEEIALCSGYGVLVCEKEDNRKEHFSKVYTAHILKNNEIGGQSIKKETIEKYNGFVHCVQVPTGKILVKRNRCTAVCGNSGDPVDILCGTYKEGHILPKSLPEHKGVVELLWDIFGGTVNEQGYKVLDSHIGAIYGDSITPERCTQICERLKAKGFASTNVVFGIGSYTYQYITRDSLGFAMKATSVTINGKKQAIFKDPITDDGTKKSAKGRVVVLEDEENGIHYVDSSMYNSSELNLLSQSDLLTPIFENGKLLKETSLVEVRSRLNDN